MTESQQEALDLAQGQEPAPKNIERVAAKVGDEDARWAFTQWELRKRARAKFALADQMLFDRDGLEMATHERVAQYHASHFPDGDSVADLCCGIGGDLIALARRGPVVGYETDRVRAEHARHNLAAHGLEGEVRNCAADISTLKCDSVFLDPQRRGNDGYGEPDPVKIIEECNFDVAVVKLGTGYEMEQVQDDTFPHVEAVSFGFECRELLATNDGREGKFAVHIETGIVNWSIFNEPSFMNAHRVEHALQFLHQADPALIKAECLGTVMEDLRIGALGDSNGFLCSTVATISPLLRSYRVVYDGPGDHKTTQAELRRLGASIVEVKTRGVKERAETIRGRFKSAGDRTLTLVVWPVGKSLRHTLVEHFDPKEYGFTPSWPLHTGLQ